MNDIIKDEELPKSWAKTFLDVIRSDRKISITPSMDAEKYFELYSIPSYSNSIPELVQGKEIGSSKFVVEPDTVLIGKINPRINRVWVVGDHSNHKKIASTEWIPFFPIIGIIPLFLKYYLSTNIIRNFLARNASGVGGSLMRIKPTTFNDYPFPLPPLPEQHRIVAKIEELFSRLDVGIASLEQTRDRLKIYRQAVLKHAFEGKLTEKWRQQHAHTMEPAEKLLEKIKKERETLFNNQLDQWQKETAQWEQNGKQGKKPVKPKKPEELPSLTSEEELREIPELQYGWCGMHMQALLSLKKKGMTTGPFGTMLKKNEHQVKGIPVLGIENIGNGVFAPGNKIFVSKEKSNELLPFEVEGGDIIISRSGTVGEICVVPRNIGFALISTNLIRISVNDSIVLPKYFVYLFQGGGRVMYQVKKLCKGSSRDFLNQSILNSIVFPIPSIQEQHQIVAEIESRLSVCDKLEETVHQALAQAESLRQSILKKAFAGKLVPQDPADEPAHILLERIRAQKEKMNLQTPPTKNKRKPKRTTP